MFLARRLVPPLPVGAACREDWPAGKDAVRVKVERLAPRTYDQRVSTAEPESYCCLADRAGRRVCLGDS